MKQYAGKILKFILFFGLGILLIWLATYQLTPSQRENIRTAFYEAHYWVLVPVLLIGVASHLLRAWRWRLLMYPMGYRPSLWNVFAAVMIGYLANLAIPRMGEVTRCGVLARNGKIPVDRLIGTMIAERAVDLLSLAVILLAAVGSQRAVLGAFFNHNIVRPLVYHFRPGADYRGMLLIVAVVVLLCLGYLLLRLFRATRWYGKLRSILRGIREGLVSLGRLQHKSWFFLSTILIWIAYFLMMYIGFLALDDTAGLGLPVALAVLGFGSIGMVLTQGGIGAYQLLVAKTLTLYGIAEGVGYAFGWISWLAQTLLIVVLGLGCLSILPFLKPGRRAKA
ncbi:lysylphosphatidylglycerol synthase transmembrane domain-containing protein [Compostibacter hankyongensis]